MAKYRGPNPTMLYALNIACEKLSSSLGRPPTAVEVAKEIGTTPQNIWLAYKKHDCLPRLTRVRSDEAVQRAKDNRKASRKKTGEAA